MSLLLHAVDAVFFLIVVCLAALLVHFIHDEWDKSKVTVRVLARGPPEPKPSLIDLAVSFATYPFERVWALLKFRFNGHKCNEGSEGERGIITGTDTNWMAYFKEGEYWNWSRGWEDSDEREYKEEEEDETPIEEVSPWMLSGTTMEEVSFEPEMEIDKYQLEEDAKQYEENEAENRWLRQLRQRFGIDNGASSLDALPARSSAARARLSELGRGILERHAQMSDTLRQKDTHHLDLNVAAEDRWLRRLRQRFGIDGAAAAAPIARTRRAAFTACREAIDASLNNQ